MKTRMTNLLCVGATVVSQFNMSWVFLVLLTGAIIASTGMSHAAVVNPSFELPVLGNNNLQAGSFTGWTASNSNAGVQDYDTIVFPNATNGVQHAYANGPDAGGPSTLSQLLSDTVVSGGTYTLTVDVGLRMDFTGQATIRLYGSTLGPATPLSNTNGTAQLTPISPSASSYLLNQTVTYTALGAGDPFLGQQIGIALVGTSGIQVIFDDVTFNAATGSSAVPEPSTYALGLIGLAGLGLVAWRRKYPSRSA